MFWENLFLLEFSNTGKYSVEFFALHGNIHPCNIANLDSWSNLQDTFGRVSRKITTARLIEVEFLSNFHQVFVSACTITSWPENGDMR